MSTNTQEIFAIIRKKMTSKGDIRHNTKDYGHWIMRQEARYEEQFQPLMRLFQTATHVITDQYRAFYYDDSQCEIAELFKCADPYLNFREIEHTHSMDEFNRLITDMTALSAFHDNLKEAFKAEDKHEPTDYHAADIKCADHMPNYVVAYKRHKALLDQIDHDFPLFEQVLSVYTECKNDFTQYLESIAELNSKLQARNQSEREMLSNIKIITKNQIGLENITHHKDIQEIQQVISMLKVSSKKILPLFKAAVALHKKQRAMTSYQPHGDYLAATKSLVSLIKDIAAVLARNKKLTEQCHATIKTIAGLNITHREGMDPKHENSFFNQTVKKFLGEDYLKSYRGRCNAERALREIMTFQNERTPVLAEMSRHRNTKPEAIELLTIQLEVKLSEEKLRPMTMHQFR